MYAHIRHVTFVIFFALQSWSAGERLVALDDLIESCEPTQVRHMMAIIEPQFQRDFISLLPKEVSSSRYLDAKMDFR